jgi:dihydrofolate synthase/folylpolyglutamate synthase
MKAGLENIEVLLGHLGDPHKSISTVQVVGSNGKGSTIAIVDHVLRKQGVKTARYHSPHLISFCERIRFNNEFISIDELSQIILEIKSVSLQFDLEPTFFEVITAAAFVYFNKVQPDIVLLEAGLGGRLDSTNVVHSKWSILTSISLEHSNILGSTYEEILREKLGVVNQEQICCFNLQDYLVKEAIEIIEANDAKPINVNESSKQYDLSAFDIDLEFKGEFFKKNLDSAIVFLKEYGIEEKSIFRALKDLPDSFWPGRYQKLKEDNLPALLLDGAHNTDAIDLLLQSVKKDWGESVDFVIGVSQDREPQEWLSFFEEFKGQIHLVKCEHLKLLSTDVLKKTFRNADVYDDVENCFEALKKRPSQKVVVTGSLYFISEWIEYLRFHYQDLERFKNLKMEFNERAK